jgi:Fe-coproporphyrin III synthase
MMAPTLYQRIQRFRTLKTDRIFSLPVVILMPHSACNCRCVMCDIWKDNKNLKQLSEKDIRGLIESLKKFGTTRVVMSGGEAMLNPHFFSLCAMIRKLGISITVLSTGLTLRKYAEQLLLWTDEVIVSLDGDQTTHDLIRNIPLAFDKLKEGVNFLKKLEPDFPVKGRSVIQKLNFRAWLAIISSAKELGLDQISFLPADVSSHAFNREILWTEPRQHEILPSKEELSELSEILNKIITDFENEFQSGFIAESPEKLRKIYSYYAAFYGINPFPEKKCNAPWVSAVIEADGSVRPCFFHGSIGNIRKDSFEDIMNSEPAIGFRKKLDTNENSVCKKCVCYLNLKPGTSI